jgi:integrase
MTASGIAQVIERRGMEAGVEVYPHKFRHTFSQFGPGGPRAT